MTVTIAALMDAILVYCFMKWFHPWAGILENEETENFDGAEAVPNPEPQEILNAEADPGNNLTIASCSFPKIPEAEPLLQQDANPENFGAWVRAHNTTEAA